MGIRGYKPSENGGSKGMQEEQRRMLVSGWGLGTRWGNPGGCVASVMVVAPENGEGEGADTRLGTRTKGNVLKLIKPNKKNLNTVLMFLTI